MPLIRHTAGWSGTWQPGDAHPPLKVTFVDGLALVPMSVFDSPQFQVYWRIEQDEGVWRLEEPEPRVHVTDGSPCPCVPERVLVEPKPKPKARRRVAVPPATSKPKVRPAPPSVRRSS